MNKKVTELVFQAFEDRGVEARPFIQGMLNHLTFGKQRYKDHTHTPEEMVQTAILSAQIALDYNYRERLIDAANYCFLAYRLMDDTGSLDGDSPGVVENGIITKARGRFVFLNETKF